MNTTSLPPGFRVIAVLALLWNLAGLAMFLLQVTMSPQAVAALPPAQQQIHAATPGWINLLFGLAVAGGVLGSLGLLLRKHWAERWLQLSLAAVAAQMLASYVLTPAWALTGLAGAAFPVALVLIAWGLCRFAHKANARGLLR